MAVPLNSKPELESVRAVQSRLGVSRPTVYRLLRAGELRSIQIGRARRILSSSVDDLIQRRLAS